MNCRTLYVIGLLFILIPARLMAQDNSPVVFSSDQEGYRLSLNTYLQRVPDKQQKDILDNFDRWVQIYQPEENEWIEMAEVSNQLVRIGVSRIPQFSDFLYACLAFDQEKLGRQALITWLQFLRVELNKDPGFLSQVSSMWSFWPSFFSQNLLYSSGMVEWQLETATMQLEADSTLVLAFENAVLTGRAGREESKLRIQKGHYLPVFRELYGEQSTTTWEEVDLPTDQVYAEFDHIALDLTRTTFSFDSVWLHDLRYFNQPVPGRYENKLATGLPAERRSYPRFTSYKTNNQIKNIYPAMDYQGGYSLQGQKLIGTSLDQSQGHLLVYYNDQPQITIRSDYFVFTPDKATGVNAAVAVYLGTDSIFHPGLSFTYRSGTDEITFIRDGQGLSNSRFFDYYHQLDLDVGMLSWKREEARMKLSGMFGSLQNQAEFESTDFYSIERFNQIQVADLVNPLILIKNCAEHYHSRYFTTGDLAAFMDKPFHAVEEMLLNVSFLDFVRYDSERKMIEVTQKTFDFVKKHAREQDYDIIRFRSDQIPPDPNGYIDLQTLKLDLFGVDSVQLSQERQVSIYPDQQKLSIGKDRRLEFDGYVRSGLADFYGKGFVLDYASFELRLDQVSEIGLRVHVPRNNSWESTDLVRVRSVIENTSGTLFIDDPANKSGMAHEELPQYPLFEADTLAYVYYDQPEIQQGMYTRDSFFFSTDRLRIPGLNSLFLKDSLFFPGRFVTAGIFPEIQVNLAYQSDHSLGFDTLFTPDEGYPVYGGKGTFYNQINMNANGLLGKGILDYLGANMESENFLFLPDEVRSLVTQMDIAENMAERGSPKTAGNEVTVTWNPRQNSLIANQKDGLLELYEGAVFEGDLMVEPEGLSGQGTLAFSGFRISSDDFQFFQNTFEARQARLDVVSQTSPSSGEPEPDEILDWQILEASVFVDLPDQDILIRPEQENSFAYFPENAFKASFSEARWQIGDPLLQLDSTRLISLQQTQKELAFSGLNSTFDRRQYRLQTNGIERITVADVNIIPSDGTATVRKSAFIDDLSNCLIVPRDTTRKHLISQARVSLISSDDYKARGTYAYTDRAGRVFPVAFSQIQVNAQGITTARGQVEADDAFYLSPEYAYQGEIGLSMQNPMLEFDGYFQLSHDCTAVTPKWISVRSELNPTDIRLPVDSLTRDIFGEKVYSGFFLSNQPIEAYSTFLGPHTRYSDHPLLSLRGELRYDDESGQFKLASVEKHTQPDLVLPEMLFDRQNCETEALGVMDLGIDLGQVKTQLAGRASHDLNTDTLRLHVVLSLDFFMNDKAMEYMARELNRYTRATAVNYSDSRFREALRYDLGGERAAAILEELSLRGGFRRMPDELSHSIQFAHVEMVWDADRGAFISEGPIGISNIGDTPVNKVFNGYLELTHRRGGGGLNLYIETEPGSYFFFNYNRGLMQVLAGPEYEKFNEYVRDTKEAKRKSQAEGPTYQYYIGQYRLVRNFLTSFTGQ